MICLSYGSFFTKRRKVLVPPRSRHLKQITTQRRICCYILNRECSLQKWSGGRPRPPDGVPSHIQRPDETPPKDHRYRAARAGRQLHRRTIPPSDYSSPVTLDLQRQQKSRGTPPRSKHLASTRSPCRPPITWRSLRPLRRNRNSRTKPFAWPTTKSTSLSPTHCAKQPSIHLRRLRNNGI